MENRDPAHSYWVKGRRITLVLAAFTLLVLLLSAPDSFRDANERQRIYLFSRDFLEDIPERLSGPGRFRFVLQPLLAIILGIRSGLTDAGAGRPPFLSGMIFHRKLRSELIKSAFTTLINLLLMGILMDSIFQWVIFGTSYPGAALVVGPLLTLVPYIITRALTNRFAQ
jgi:hypothetical protein